MGFLHDFDLTQAWLEIERFYDYLRSTFITFFGATISLWNLILSEFVACSLVDVFLYFTKHNSDDDE